MHTYKLKSRNVKSKMVANSDLSGTVQFLWEEKDASGTGTVTMSAELPDGVFPAAVRAVLANSLPGAVESVVEEVVSRLILGISPDLGSAHPSPIFLGVPDSYVGRDVLTAAHLEARDFQDRRASARKAGTRGIIVESSTAHGLSLKVRHSDGTESWYLPKELSIVGPSVAETIQG